MGDPQKKLIDSHKKLLKKLLDKSLKNLLTDSFRSSFKGFSLEFLQNKDHWIRNIATKDSLKELL